MKTQDATTKRLKIHQAALSTTQDELQKILIQNRIKELEWVLNA